MSYKDFNKDQTFGGDLTVSGTISGGFLFGDASNLTNLPTDLSSQSSVQNISGAYTTTTSDNNIFCDGNFPLTLHDASTGFDATLSRGQEMMFNNIGTETVNISGTIQGDINPDLLSGEIFNIISNGTGWYWKS